MSEDFMFGGFIAAWVLVGISGAHAIDRFVMKNRHPDTGDFLGIAFVGGLTGPLCWLIVGLFYVSKLVRRIVDRFAGEA
jgi:hypothetical protein